MCSAVGSARANAVNAVPVAVAVEACHAGGRFSYITVSERVGNIISSLARNDNNDDNDDDEKDGGCDDD